MSKYFECNLDMDVSYLEQKDQIRFKETAEKITKRHEKLEEALNLSKMRPADFAETAAKLFEHFEARFDAYSAKELAEAVIGFWDGKRVEDRIEWPNPEVVFDCRFVARKDWEDMRKTGVGGSAAPIVEGVSPYGTLRSLVYQIKGKEAKSDDEDNPVFDRGHFVEDNVVEAFCKLTGAKRIPESRMFRSKDFPAATANIDAIVLLKGKLYVFEAKTTKAQNFESWRNGQIPQHYIPQCRQYPAVLNDPRIDGTYIGCLFVDDLIISQIYCGSGYDYKKFQSRFVPRNPEIEEQQLCDEQDFWDTYIGLGEEPPLSGDPEMDEKVMNDYDYSAPPAGVFIPATEIVPDDAIRELLDEYDRLDMKVRATDSILKQQKIERDNLKIDIISLLNGSNTGIVEENDTTFLEIKYKAPKDKDVVDMEKLEVAYPDAYADCVEKKPQSPRFTFLHKTKWETWKESYMEPPKPKKPRKKKVS